MGGLWTRLLRGLRVLRPHNPFLSRQRYGCRRRLTVNIYKGCGWRTHGDAADWRCLYCYAVSTTRVEDLHHPRPKEDFRRRLDRDLKRYRRSHLPKYPVYLSSNSDPFQILEEWHGHALYTLRRLGEEGYPIILMTKNPGMLLKPGYLEAVAQSRSVVEVTIPFLDGRFEPGAPSPLSRIRAVRELVGVGLRVLARVDPIIPTFGRVQGQTREELWSLVGRLAEAGVSHVISKVLHLVNPGKLRSRRHLHFYRELLPLYLTKGFRISVSTFMLNPGDASSSRSMRRVENSGFGCSPAATPHSSRGVDPATERRRS